MNVKKYSPGGMSLELKDKAVMKWSYLKILNMYKCVYHYVQENISKYIICMFDVKIHVLLLVQPLYYPGWP